MGWYIRKSKKVGPLRINLSKSGIGVSTGIKGLRISKGPKGTYLNAGRGGIYYRKKISGPNKTKTKTENKTSSYEASPVRLNRIQSNTIKKPQTVETNNTRKLQYKKPSKHLNRALIKGAIIQYYS